MNILLFTHKIDIDGMGSAVLSKLVFDSVDIEYCDTFEINDKLSQKIQDSSILNYDKIFVTDICPSENLIERIEKIDELNSKFKILDHHLSILEKMKKPHKIAKLMVENLYGKCSGTSLFYEYLKENNLILPTESIDEFVELTRQYDTWEWKNKFNNEKANDLNIMFSILGLNAYIEDYYNKLKNNLNLFSENDQSKITAYREQLKQICENYINQIHVENVQNNVVAVIDDMKDEYKNDVAEMLKLTPDINIDFISMFIPKRNTLTMRAINSEINVGKIAEHFGGKGHKSASSCTLTPEVKSAFNIKTKNNVIENQPEK